MVNARFLVLGILTGLDSAPWGILSWPILACSAVRFLAPFRSRSTRIVDYVIRAELWELPIASASSSSSSSGRLPLDLDRRIRSTLPWSFPRLVDVDDLAFLEVLLAPELLPGSELISEVAGSL